MSINVLVFGADKESAEYEAAEKLKEIILNTTPSAAVGEIVLFASATLFGQAVKDIDLLMIGEIKSGYSVTADFSTMDSAKRDKVEIRSFCTTIEVKGHDISGIFRNVDFKCERRGINSPRLLAAIPFSVSGLVVRFSVFCLIAQT